MIDQFKKFYKKLYLVIYIVFLWGQWAMWSNPSLPVGDTSQGVGLFPGEVMFSINGNYQFIDWEHDELKEEPDSVGKHLGTLDSYIAIPSFTVGLTDYLNINFSQVLGVRSMNWDNDSPSIHHRDETSLSDYINAVGGLFGDSSVKLRYLYKNAGMKEGSRIYFGLGLSLPSKSMLFNSKLTI